MKKLAKKPDNPNEFSESDEESQIVIEEVSNITDENLSQLVKSMSYIVSKLKNQKNYQQAFQAFNESLKLSGISPTILSYETLCEKKSKLGFLYYSLLPGQKLYSTIQPIEHESKQINRDINKEIKLLRKDLDKIKEDNLKLKSLFYDLSTEHDSSARIQTIPVDIYIDTNDSFLIFNVYESVINYLKSIDFISAFEFEPENGSWYKKLVARSIRALKSDEVQDRFKEMEYALQVNGILKQQSEIDKNQSEAFLNIVKAIENIPTVCLKIGSILTVKTTNENNEVGIYTRTLSIKELHAINKNPDLLKNPGQILIALSKIVEFDNDQEYISN